MPVHVNVWNQKFFFVVSFIPSQDATVFREGGILVPLWIDTVKSQLLVLGTQYFQVRLCFFVVFLLCLFGISLWDINGNICQLVFLFVCGQMPASTTVMCFFY